MDDLTILRELCENPELYLEDEDRELLQSNKELLDISKANSITVYGTDIQKNMAELSEMMIKSIGETNVDEISDIIDQTVTYLSDADEKAEEKKTEEKKSDEKKSKTEKEKKESADKASDTKVEQMNTVVNTNIVSGADGSKDNSGMSK